MAEQLPTEVKNYIPLDSKIVASKNKSRLIIGVGIIVLFILGPLLFKRLLPPKKPNNTKPTPTIIKTKPEKLPSTTDKKTDWVNYPNISDFRDIEVSGKDVWLAGLGSLTHIDQFNNKIIKAYTMLDGLVSNTTTAVKRQNEFLWIASQGGINRINLKNNEIRSYTVDDGLVNSSNIGFALSGYDLWIGTFDGVSRYNTKTDSFTNYKTELGSFATKWSVNDRLWPDVDGVWFIIGANIYSSGGVAFYDSYNDNWYTYSASEITGKDTDRINLFSLAVGDDKVWTTGGAEIYEFNKKIKTWTTRPDILTEINKQTGQAYINSDSIIGYNKPYLYFFTNNRIFQYDTQYNNAKNNIKMLYQITKDNTDDYYKLIKKINDKIYFVGKDGIYYYQLKDNKFIKLAVSNIPINYDQIFGSFDKKLLLSINGDISLFDTKTEKVTPLSGLVYEQAMQGDPTLVYDQFHNQIWYLSPAAYFEDSCTPAKLKKYHLKTGQIINIELPNTDSGCGPMLNKIILAYNNNLYFIGDKLYIYNPQSQSEDQWLEVDYLVSSFYQDNQNQIWFMTDRGIGVLKENSIDYQIDKQDIPGLTKEFIIVNNKLYFISIEETVNLYFYDLNSKSLTKLDLPAGQGEINDITLSDNSLWIASNKGLIKYDLTTQKFELYTTRQGLMGNVINQVEIVNDKPWAIVNWGGLAGYK